MRRRIINNQHTRFIKILAKVVNSRNQELRIDIAVRLISDGDIIGAKDAEQTDFLISLRKDFNLFTLCLPRIRQTRIHGKGRFVSEIKIDPRSAKQLPKRL